MDSRVQVSSDESERLIKMEETLHQRVIGQEEAVVAISRAIRRARVGLKNPNRPIASFIFSGQHCCLSLSSNQRAAIHRLDLPTAQNSSQRLPDLTADLVVGYANIV